MALYPWQTTLWDPLVRTRAQQRLGHAFLITGNKGIGKTRFAEYLVSWILCNQPEANPCGKCRSCILKQKKQHPDYYELSYEDENLNMDMARFLKTKLADSAQQGGARVVLIKSAEKLTVSASNALLKTLEEPPLGIYFILLTDRPVLLPVTIRSRCQILHHPVVEHQVAFDWIKPQVSVSNDVINKALLWTSDAPLLALNLLKDRQEFSEKEQQVNEFLNLLQGKISALYLANRWADKDESQLFATVDYVMRRAVRLANGANGNPKMFTNVPLIKWFSLYEEILKAQQELWSIAGLNRQLFWETLLFKFEAI